jgi:phage tail sheath protein FI
MPELLTPGLYYEAVDAERQPIRALRTDVAGFVGLALRGPIGVPVPVSSWAQFESAFGGLVRDAHLGYAVRAFFENGGRTCHVVRAAGTTAQAARAVARDRRPKDAFRFEASSEGAWGNALSVRVWPVVAAATRTDTKLVQPANRRASFVQSVVGFSRGAHVRVSQPGRVTYRVSEAVDVQLSRLAWDSPLPAAFDLNAPISLEAMELSARVSLAGRPQEQLSRLSILPTSERALPKVFAEQSVLFRADDLRGAAPDLHDPAAVELGANAYRLAQGKDGLADLTPTDFTEALRALEDIDAVAMVAVPDLHLRPRSGPPAVPSPEPPKPDPCLPGRELAPGPAAAPTPVSETPPEFTRAQVLRVQRALVRHCEDLHDRVALLDPPLPARGDALDVGELQAWRQEFDSSMAAAYHPWLLVRDPLAILDEVVRAVPPSGHVAGLIARTDLGRGVHVPPANAELDWAEGVTVELGPELQSLLNPQGINCIRPFSGRGIRVYGDRTVSSDTSWRFLNVRRLLLMIEGALEQSLQWTTFEPADIALRQTLSATVGGFLRSLWEDGALAGGRPEDAFFVRCGDQENPRDQVALGRVVALVGVAAVRPAEFVIVRVGRTEGGVEVREAGR